MGWVPDSHTGTLQTINFLDWNVLLQQIEKTRVDYEQNIIEKEQFVDSH